MYLLDTCALLWLAGGSHDRLSAPVSEVLKLHPGHISVSAISALEIGLKVRRGKLRIKVDPGSWFERAVSKHGLHEIPVNGSVAAASTMLPLLHKDPCDRIIISTARKYDLVVLTPDRLISQYPEIRTFW